MIQDITDILVAHMMDERDKQPNMHLYQQKMVDLSMW
jgi:hypothetical protein